MMDAYAQRRGIAVDSLRFALDGNRISPDDTPKMVTPPSSPIFDSSNFNHSIVGT